jgi:hypothetical protein
MAVSNYLDREGTELLWQRIVSLLNKKLDHITNSDGSIDVTDRNNVSVRISPDEDNILKLDHNKGLYVKAPDKMHKLTFGADQYYTYDGSEDITVPVYMGKTN